MKDIHILDNQKNIRERELLGKADDFPSLSHFDAVRIDGELWKLGGTIIDGSFLIKIRVYKDK